METLFSCTHSGVSAIHKGIGDNFVNVIQWTSTFFVAFIVGFIKDWRLTLVLIGVTPLLFISGLLFAKVSGVWGFERVACMLLARSF